MNTTIKIVASEYVRRAMLLKAPSLLLEIILCSAIIFIHLDKITTRTTDPVSYKYEFIIDSAELSPVGALVPKGSRLLVYFGML